MPEKRQQHQKSALLLKVHVKVHWAWRKEVTSKVYSLRETARYAFIESGCLSIDKEDQCWEWGDSNAINSIMSVSAMPMWSLRSSLPLKIIQKFTITSMNLIIENILKNFQLFRLKTSFGIVSPITLLLFLVS